MKKLSVLILSGLFAAGAFAQAATTPVEANKPGSARAEAAAQARVDARPQGMDKSARQPEAQVSGNSRATATAERRHRAKLRHAKKSWATRQAERNADKP
jgi:uncharacterized protein involved in high-affinity Fe2+ transport